LHKKQNLPKLTLANSKWVIVLAVTALLLFFGFTFYMRYYFQFPSTLDDPLAPPYFKHAEDAKPFPRTLNPSQFQSGEVREAYAVATEMPDVLVQQPSYCRQPILHSLLDCFVNLEATNCETCVEEARLVDQLHRQGKTASEIRAVIVHQYGVVSARPVK
jgi:hypothetical protein